MAKLKDFNGTLNFRQFQISLKLILNKSFQTILDKFKQFQTISNNFHDIEINLAQFHIVPKSILNDFKQFLAIFVNFKQI